MKTQIVTTGIVLSRTDFQEADRIITILTKDQGKVRLIAKGVRRVKSKLAGGIELFSISEFTYIAGKGEIGTLISSRLIVHYSEIVTDLDRTLLGYELLKRTNKVTEDAVGHEYFDLLLISLEALNRVNLHIETVEFWFIMQLLYISGHAPNLRTDLGGNKFDAGQNYEFEYSNMAFRPSPSGPFGPGHIKLLGLGLRLQSPAVFNNVTYKKSLLLDDLQLARVLLSRALNI